MRTYAAFGICLLANLALSAQNQPDWERITPRIFEPLEREIADSIAARRAEGDSLRIEMRNIVSAKKFDPSFIFGPEEKYLKEGMHKNFKAEPLPLQALYERDTAVVRLEHLHVGLYRSDKALFRWFSMQGQMNQAKKYYNQFAWDRRYQQLPEAERRGIDQQQAWASWAAHELVCLMTTSGVMGAPVDDPGHKIEPLSIDFDLIRNDTAIFASARHWSFPLSADKILASFPMNGQYAFCPEESIRGTGYMVLPKAALSMLVTLLEAQMLLKARWTCADGTVTYTNAGPEAPYKVNILYFSLPHAFFQPGKVYHLELVAVPQSALVLVESLDQCWQKFRDGSTKTALKAVQNPGEVGIAGIYFRTGHYSVREKCQTLKGSLDLKAGAISFTTDEPFDAAEIFGSAGFPPPVTFSAGHEAYFLGNKLYDPVLGYYFMVPKVENLGQLPAGELAVAERDNTLDAPFVRKVSLAKVDNYFKMYDASDKPVDLGGGYLMPVGRPALLPDSLLTDKPVPYITRAHFEQGPPELGQVRCTLYIGELQKMAREIALQRAQILKRAEERAQFFYALEQRRAKREGKAAAGDLDFYRSQELENLPDVAKYLLQNDLDQALQAGLTIEYIRNFPGSNQRTAILPVKF